MTEPSPAAKRGSSKGETQIQEPTRAERTIARRVAESRATVPDLELSTEADMTASVAACEAADCRVSILAMLVRACALALRESPRANAAYRDGSFELYSRINVGVALPREQAYVLATLFDADEKSLAEIDAELIAMTSRARSGELTPPELSGATFTLVDFGDYDVTRSTIVINPPHAAALAAGAVRAVPVVRDGVVAPGLSMTLTLACDHRILYGEIAAVFLTRIKSLLETPAM